MNCYGIQSYSKPGDKRTDERLMVWLFHSKNHPCKVNIQQPCECHNFEVGVKKFWVLLLPQSVLFYERKELSLIINNYLACLFYNHYLFLIANMFWQETNKIFQKL
jgi:hypothetical protein